MSAANRSGFEKQTLGQRELSIAEIYSHVFINEQRMTNRLTTCGRLTLAPFNAVSGHLPLPNKHSALPPKNNVPGYLPPARTGV